ncbi:MAG: hypothetical protein K1060chlam5_00022 [Candidatus Anoxychlamydiales bacterium]|nr:hypothetical protein [Candidatus Anoxychlamydiales bacterium]
MLERWTTEYDTLKKREFIPVKERNFFERKVYAFNMCFNGFLSRLDETNENIKNVFNNSLKYLKDYFGLTWLIEEPEMEGIRATIFKETKGEFPKGTNTSKRTNALFWESRQYPITPPKDTLQSTTPSPTPSCASSIISSSSPIPFSIEIEDELQFDPATQDTTDSDPGLSKYQFEKLLKKHNASTDKNDKANLFDELIKHPYYEKYLKIILDLKSPVKK